MSLENASLIVTPNAFKAGKLYSVIPQDGSGDFTASRATTATRVNENGLIESVAVDVPRIDYTNGNCPSILVEGQATNKLLYSNDFTNVEWEKIIDGTGVAPVITANNEVSPDGTMNADKIVFNSGGGTTTSDKSLLRQNAVLGSGVKHNGSIYLKGETGGEQITILRWDGGVVLETLTTNWQRYDTTGTSSGTVRSFSIGIRQAVAGTINSTATIYAWGAQLEEGTEPSSYIPTTTSTVTRNADVLSTTVPAGVTEIVEELEDGTTNTITNIPATYTPDPNRYKYILMQ